MVLSNNLNGKNIRMFSRGSLMDLYNSAMWAMCTYCQTRLPKAHTITCEKCRCPLYCSSKCRDADIDNSSNAAHSHKNWCSKMRAFMESEKQIAKFPFDFAKDTASKTFDAMMLSQFLMKKGVFGKGMWRRECLLWMPPDEDFFETAVPLPGEFKDDSSTFPWVLPSESVALSAAPVTPLSGYGLRNWEEYYNWRGFSLDSPIAVLQQWPLTVYHIVSHRYSHQHPESYANIQKRKDKEIKIHIIGAEKEVELLNTFVELTYLMPGILFNLVFVGKEISPKVDGETTVLLNVRMTIRRGVYHSLCGLETPDLVVGFNAGLAVYLTWPETIQHLKMLKVPAYFTDYCPYSCECGKMMLKAQHLGDMSVPEVNPFRSPLRILSDQNNLPWFSNALIYRLLPES